MSKPKPKVGRPTKLTQALQDKLCSKIRKGLPIVDSCALCDIDEQTYYSWVSRGEAGEEPFTLFLGALKKAHAEMKEYCLDILDKSTDNDNNINWTPMAWKLERRDRLNFGRQDKEKPETSKLDPKTLADKLKLVEGEAV